MRAGLVTAERFNGFIRDMEDLSVHTPIECPHVNPDGTRCVDAGVAIDGMTVPAGVRGKGVDGRAPFDVAAYTG
jgi:hypothetical protein